MRLHRDLYSAISRIANRHFPAKLKVLSHSITQTYPRGDAQLWLTALALSLLVSLGLLILMGLIFVQWQWFKVQPIPPSSAPEATATIYIQAPSPDAVTKALETSEQKFARTSDDQEAPKREEKSEFIGERNTTATSDAPPDASAKLLPSQNGIEREEDRDIETTESRYQDGEISESPSTPTPSAEAVSVQDSLNPSTQEITGETQAKDPGEALEKILPAKREVLLDGPNAVEVRVPKEQGLEEKPKVTPQNPNAEQSLPKESVVDSPTPAEQMKPKTFSGYQRKTAVVGSISRTGKSALNVDDTVMGRYQAAISKAVEQEWQRNCVRHRDFITPGFLTVRFFVDAAGKVKSVTFVGEMETGEIQKGFTLNSIRDAEIPAMPKEMKPVYEDESLELIFRFYF